MMQIDKLIKDYKTKINVTLEAKNDLFIVEKKNKKLSKRAVKAVNNIYKLQSKNARKEQRKLKYEMLLSKEERKNDEPINPATHDRHFK